MGHDHRELFRTVTEDLRGHEERSSKGYRQKALVPGRIFVAGVGIQRALGPDMDRRAAPDRLPRRILHANDAPHEDPKDDRCVVRIQMAFLEPPPTNDEASKFFQIVVGD